MVICAGTTVQRENWTDSENVAFDVEEKNGNPVTQTDDHVKHVRVQSGGPPLGESGHREKSREKKVKKTKDWKAVRGYWDGSKKSSGWSGCGVVIKAVDKVKWITITNIAVLL